MKIQLKGKLIECLPIQTGTSNNGEWKKQDIIVETDGQYPKKICVSIWGDKINKEYLQVGKNLIIDIDIESRSYNNRWYTDIKAWRIESAEKDKEVAKNTAETTNFNQDQFEEEDDGLPF